MASTHYELTAHQTWKMARQHHNQFPWRNAWFIAQQCAYIHYMAWIRLVNRVMRITSFNTNQSMHRHTHWRLECGHGHQLSTKSLGRDVCSDVLKWFLTLDARTDSLETSVRARILHAEISEAPPLGANVFVHTRGHRICSLYQKTLFEYFSHAILNEDIFG